jgi:hypothetical protein
MLHANKAIISIAYVTIELRLMSVPGRRQIEGDDIGNRDWGRSLLQKPRENLVVKRRQWGEAAVPERRFVGRLDARTAVQFVVAHLERISQRLRSR